MTRFAIIATPLLALTLAACASTGSNQVAQAPVAAPITPVYSAPLVASPAQNTQQALLTTSVSNGFVDTAALAQMSAKDSAAANTAQFYALQFGRPGAPRAWTGDKGTTGSVAVGPYVRVNNLDCRDFTHTVKIGGQEFVKKGTACREQNGNWTVEKAAA
ncbi:RT0821/Lpp0805 family surface protein [Devosia neptuniae]|jgi:surface antigen|uniref:RT0821/Lpp0805 family surface protein n=1 Tax=Devosia TaxID=46913 RepID=UPI0022AEB6FC|nr:RT0821/Lpp0805 family surface protein [Devosia neptuniae]MCZ4344895.1 RT0821/Lpp0805 family surface protein [Devosia neptuniae]|tara:strand:- start:19976 stop:20455 length:480 start_codon:yes stop_codon:yes gene_type:complete